MLGKTLTLVTLAAAIVLLFILQTTNPSTAGPAGILAVFFLLYIVFFGCLVRCIHALSWVASRVSRSTRLRRPIKTISLQHSAYLSSIVAMAPIMLIAMSSVGKLGFYETVLVIVFVVLGVFYVEKRQA